LSVAPVNQEVCLVQEDVEAATAPGSCLFIGQNRCGGWIVKDGRNACGRLFAERTAAIRFAMYECQRRPQSVIMLPGGLEVVSPFETDGRGGSAHRLAA
jgi:hypothetical protein